MNHFKTTPIFLYFICAFVSTSLLAQKTITVNNTPGTAADYTNVQDAINAANPGDTVYVQHSETSYGDITINKRINLRGRSHSLKGYITTIDNLELQKGCDGFTIQGFNITNELTAQDKVTYTNIEIANNKINRILFSVFGNVSDFDALIIRGNVVKDFYLGSSNFKNIVLTNTIFFSTFGADSDVDIEGKFVVKNCILNSSNGFGLNLATGTLELSNCIFISNNEGDDVVEYGDNAENTKVIIKKCISYNYNALGTLTFKEDKGVELIGNLDNTNPKFVNVNPNSDSSIINNNYSLNEDLRLQPDAPMPNAGIYRQ